MSDTPRTDALLAKWHGEWGADALLTLTRELERELNAARPEERPRLSVMPIVKTLKDQRDECAEVLRQIMAKLREENPEPDDLMYPFSFDSSWEQLATAADAILAKCPSYEQQLRNVAEGIGMTYEKLIEAVKLLPAMNSGPLTKEKS